MYVEKRQSGVSETQTLVSAFFSKDWTNAILLDKTRSASSNVKTVAKILIGAQVVVSGVTMLATQTGNVSKEVRDPLSFQFVAEFLPPGHHYVCIRAGSVLAEQRYQELE